MFSLITSTLLQLREIFVSTKYYFKDERTCTNKSFVLHTCIWVNDPCPFKWNVSSAPNSRSELLPSKSCGEVSDSSSAKIKVEANDWLVNFNCLMGKEHNLNFNQSNVWFTWKFKWVIYHFDFFLSVYLVGLLFLFLLIFFHSFEDCIWEICIRIFL